MRPIAHVRRQSSRATWSRRAVDALVVGNPVPIGIPALFLADQLSRGRSGEQILSGKRGLIAEYAGAEGYAYRWGHVIEVRLGRFVLWRVVPVALWERLSDVRVASPLLIEELLTMVQPAIPPALTPHLPSGVVARGCQGASRRGPHALFTLLLTEQCLVTAVRQWLAVPFVTDLLPTMLDSVEERMVHLLRAGTCWAATQQR
jgi:hypothetical protein